MRLVIEWHPKAQRWVVLDEDDETVDIETFAHLADAGRYVRSRAGDAS